MKKILFCFFVLALLGVGCNSPFINKAKDNQKALNSDQITPITTTSQIFTTIDLNGNESSTFAKTTEKKELTYTNNKWNFNILFPTSWQGFIAKEKKLDLGLQDTVDSIDFGFSESPTLLNVGIYTSDQWDQLLQEMQPYPQLFGEITLNNQHYILGYSITKNYPSKYTKMIQELETLINNQFN